MSNSQRIKGRRFEQEIVNDLKCAGLPDARRNLGESGGQMLGVDVIAGVLRIQAKRYKAYAPISKLEEVPRELETVPALVTKGDRKETVIALYWHDFLALVVNDND